MENQGFDPKEIEKFKAKIKASGKSYVVIESEDNSDDYMNFHFVGDFDGKEVVFDVALYTLKIQHASEIYDMAEVMEELEEEDAVKVQEHVDIDENIDFGVGLDVGLNVDKITPEVIEKFIKDFTNDTLELDPTYFSFQMEGDDDEE